MRQQLKALLNQPVSLLDDRTGSTLHTDLSYWPDWWNEEIPIIVIDAGKKNFTLRDTWGKKFTYRYNRVKNVSGNEITFVSEN